MEKSLIYEAVDAKAGLLTNLSDEIWGYAELSMEEFQSAAAYIRVLKEEGFKVEESVCNISTAFLGRYGSGKPVIGILG